MGALRLSIATTDYDHFRDFRLGTVRAEGIEHVWSVLGHHEVFARFTAHREWDVAELSIAKFAAQVTRDEPDRARRDGRRGSERAWRRRDGCSSAG